MRSVMKQNDPLILTFDFGTQSVRASLFNKKGECVGMEKEAYQPAYFSPKPGYAEMDPNDYYDYLCVACKRLVESHQEEIKRVQGIVVDCFRDSAVLLDKERKVIRPMILWLDSRMAKCEDPLPLFNRFAFKLVGMDYVIKMNRRRSVMNWIKENEPENFEKCDKYVSVSTFFIYRLTGELKDTACSYTGHYPIDTKKGAWYKNPTKHFKGMVFSVKKSQLCDLVPPGGVLGQISEQAAKETGLPVGLKVFAGGSDKSCETLGAGVVDTTMAAVSLGTACSIETTTPHYTEPVRFLPGYANVIPNSYNVDIQIYRGFWMVNWYLKEFGREKIEDYFIETNPETYNSRLKNIPIGSDGLIVQPFWGPLLDRPQVKGAIIGFSDYTTRDHVYRAIIEGIGYELRYSLDGIRKQLKRRDHIRKIRISGGGAQSDEICQIMADIFNLPVSRVQTHETSSLGAAVAGFLAAGEFKNPGEAVKAMVHEEKTFVPNPKNVEIYEDLYQNAYKKLYPSLKGVYRYLYDFTAQ